MKSHLWKASAGVLLALLAAGCVESKSPSGGDGASGGQQPAGHVDVGGSIEINILVAKVKLWMTIRDADVLVVKAYDWASRQVRYLLNGEERTLSLTEEQAAEIKREIEASNARGGGGK